MNFWKYASVLMLTLGVPITSYAGSTSYETSGNVDVSNAQVSGSSGAYAPALGNQNSLGNLFTNVTKHDPDIWISGNAKLTELTPENTRFVKATGRMSMSMANSSISDYSVDDLKSIWSTFADTPNTIGLIKNTKWLPDQPDYRYPCPSIGLHMGFAAGFGLTPGKEEIDLNGEVIARDDGHGHLVATNGNGQGTVDYKTGTVLYQFNTATTADDKIWVGFSMSDGYGSHAIPSTWWTVMDQSPDVDTSIEKIQQLGYKPTVMLMNYIGCTQNNGNTALWCDMNVADLKGTLKDVQKIIPSIKHVFPYISPNAGVFGNFDTDSYWAYAKQGALYAGGFAIDMPAAFFLENSEEYRQFVVQMIKWAHKHGVVVICEITPGGADNSNRDFLSDMKSVVSYLKDNNAIPNVWYDDQYGRFVSPGTDDLRSPNYKTDSTLAAARWLADTVGTFDLPDNMVGYMGYGNIMIPPPSANNFGATRQTLGEMFSELGSMAFQPQNNVHITGGDLENMWALNITSGGQFRFGSDGTQPVPLIGDGKGSLTIGGNVFLGAGFSLSFAGSGGTGAGEPVLRSESTDHYLHLYNPFTTDSSNVGFSFDDNSGTTQALIHLDTNGSINVDTPQYFAVNSDEYIMKTLQFGGAGGTGAGEPVLRALSTDHYLHLYNPYTTDVTQVGISFDDNSGVTRNSLLLDTRNALNFSNSVNFSYGGSFTDPDVGTARDAKFGNKGIAVVGGIQRDKVQLSGSLNFNNTNAAGTKSNGISFQSQDRNFVSWINGGEKGDLYLSGLHVLADGSALINGGNVVFSGTGVNGIQFQNADNSASSWLKGDGAGGMIIGNFDFLANSDLNIGGNNIIFSNSGTNGIGFRSADASTTTFINGDGAGGINVGDILNISPTLTGTATFKNGWVLADSTGTRQTVTSLDSSGNTTITSKSGTGTMTIDAGTFKVSNGNVDFDNSQIVSDSTGNLGLQTLRLGGINSPIYLAAPKSGGQGMILHGSDDYHSINLGYDVADGKGNLTYMPNTESHLLYSSSARPAAWNFWSTNGKTPEEVAQISQSDTIFNVHTFHVGRTDAVTGNANLAFHAAGTTTPSAVIAVSGGTTTQYQGAIGFYASSSTFNGQVSSTYSPAENDSSTTLATTHWVKGLITTAAYASLPSSPYAWQDAICTDCYVSNSANTGVRVTYNPTRKVWTDMLGNPLQH